MMYLKVFQEAPPVCGDLATLVLAILLLHQCLLPQHRLVCYCFRASKHETALPVPVWNVLAWDLCPFRVRDAGWPYPCHFSTPLCLLPQHCLACLEGPCSKGCKHCECSSVECASLKLVSTLSHQGHWQGPVAKCQCLVTSTYMCGISNFTSTEPKSEEEFNSEHSIVRH